MNLNLNTITFGKYRGKDLKDVLKDRKYCSWLLEQDWFQNQYEYLYNRVFEYNPVSFFFENISTEEPFIKSYKYFNMIQPDNLQINLNENELKCYTFYLTLIENIKSKIQERINKNETNIYDIKAPTNYMKKFENEYNLEREIFKTFLYSYDLQSISKIVEDIKKEGNIEYKGAKSYLIAKENSLKQEKFWEVILKDLFNDKISTQFIFEECIFDFININLNIIFECKLGIKDFSQSQYKKYRTTLNKYNIVYLIDQDCVIDIINGYLFTSNYDKYIKHIEKIKNKKKNNNLENIIKNFNVIQVTNINTAIILICL